MLRYGNDKPDLRVDARMDIHDLSAEFMADGVTFNAFRRVIEAGGVVRAILHQTAASQPRSFFDKLNDLGQRRRRAGLGYVVFEEEGGKIIGKGPIAKFIPEAVLHSMREKAGCKAGDACSLPPTKKQPLLGWLAKPVCASPANLICSMKTASSSAGSSISQCMSGNEEEKKLIFPTTHSPCLISTITAS